MTQITSHLHLVIACLRRFSLAERPLILTWTILRMVVPVRPWSLSPGMSTEEGSFPGCCEGQFQFLGVWGWVQEVQ